MKIKLNTCKKIVTTHRNNTATEKAGDKLGGKITEKSTIIAEFNLIPDDLGF